MTHFVLHKKMSGILISGTRRLWTLTPPCSSSRFSFKQQSIRFPSSWNASLSLRSRWQSTAAHAFKAAAAETAPIVAPVARITETRRIVGHHMLWTSAFVFSMVVVGGLTRLTESGLSMVDWSLLGSRPPQTQQEWEAYFQKYKQFPEYQLLNQNMTVDEFKQIFWFEYGHRMLGRFIGAFFALPGLYFIARGYVTPSVRNRILVISGLIGFQVCCDHRLSLLAGQWLLSSVQFFPSLIFELGIIGLVHGQEWPG